MDQLEHRSRRYNGSYEGHFSTANIERLGHSCSSRLWMRAYCAEGWAEVMYRVGSGHRGRLIHRMAQILLRDVLNAWQP